MPERIEIQDGGLLLYDRQLFCPDEADRLFTALRKDIAWRQEKAYGHPLPRLNAWFADPGLSYAYSGLTHRGEGWPEWLRHVKERVEAAAGVPFNSLLLNRYRDGQDSIGFHTDAEPELGENPAVATVSFGAERALVLRHRRSKEKRVCSLAHGSVLVMAGTSQHHWLHGMPKTEEPVGERISLTFRQIVYPSRSVNGA
ncbi:MAG: alpha-ketoglutarate-dependent dioxygenase AlkB family protein [Actinomycetota bacterium]